MRILIYLILLMVVLSCQEHPVYDVVIRDVHVFDGTEDRGVVDLAIAGDTIAAISTESLQGDSVMDGTGKFIVPGLVNAHVHMWEPDMLRESFDTGVITVLDLYEPYGDSDRMRTYRDSSGFSNYYSAGMGATVRNGHPHRTLPHPDDYPFISDSISPSQFVSMAKDSGSEVVKIIREADYMEGDTLKALPTLSFDQVHLLIQASRAAGLPSIVHITDLQDALTITRFRPDGFAHFWETQGELTEEDKELFRESGVFFIPTLMIQKNINYDFLNDTTLSPEREAFERRTFLVQDSLFEQKLFEIFEAGVPLIAGTDPPNGGVNFGSDLIEELRIYARAGIPLEEVLKTATGNPAEHLPIDGNGSLKPGGPATFLVLNGNPLQDLEALSDIEVIIKNGAISRPGNYKYSFENSEFPEDD